MSKMITYIDVFAVFTTDCTHSKFAVYSILDIDLNNKQSEINVILK